MYTDGITDQFGGPRNRKFSTKQMNELIDMHALEPMDEQRMNIDDALKTWMGKSQRQLDDICMIGFTL